MRNVASALLMLLAADYALACGCSKPTSIDDTQVNRTADIIFTGDVMEVSTTIVAGIEVVAVRFNGIEFRKGTHEDVVTIEVHNGGTSCDLQVAAFQVGERYLISGFKLARPSTMDDSATDQHSNEIRYYNNFCSLRERIEVTPNNAMQRSALVVTPLAGTASGSHKLPPASGAPTARRR